LSGHKFEYGGGELELFSLAHNWKAYFGQKFAPFLGKRVLEIGAGFGAVTRSLWNARVEQWICLEPDEQLASRIQITLSGHPAAERVEVVCGVTANLASGSSYDTIVYVDVLEHIEEDAPELERSTAMLVRGGRCIVLSPAYNWLYTPFDKAIGHFRRYTASTLRAVAPATLQCEKLFYLDSIGLLASVANKLLLQQSLPTRSQILFWDRKLIPLSRVADPIIGFRAGRSIVGIWRKL
jgi:2-polyprenyl-3-methyl-5-hydroxy-6-metoxy-1,4-benzoquinol methylase